MFDTSQILTSVVPMLPAAARATLDSVVICVWGSRRGTVGQCLSRREVGREEVGGAGLGHVKSEAMNNRGWVSAVVEWWLRTMAKEVPSAPSGQSMRNMFTRGSRWMAMMKSPITSSPRLHDHRGEERERSVERSMIVGGG